jgi:exodeoxyribonuclease-5
MISDKKLGVKDLSPDQLDVYEQIVAWSNGGLRGGLWGGLWDENLLTMGGYAGTGKSSILGVFASLTQLKVAYVSFTGRASSILARKLRASGADVTDKVFTSNEKILEGRFGHLFSANPDASLCGTIHRLLYRPIINDKTDELLGWTRREKLDRNYDLVVIDEASCVGDTMLEDLRRHNTPILAVGDHGQLPPVADSGSLMQNPQLRLEKIHRQAEGNPIIQLAHRVRTEGALDRSFHDGARVVFTSKSDLSSVLETAYVGRDDPKVGGRVGGALDVGALCWTNRNRVMLNGAARKARGIRGAPREGEIIICLKNYPPIYNGMRGVLTEDATVGGNPWILDARIEFPDEGIEALAYELCAPQFNREKTYAGLEELVERGVNVDSMRAAGSLMDFGYALTVHKSQASQFEHVVLFLDRPEKPWDDDYRRFVYTAVTRAAERLTVLT